MSETIWTALIGAAQAVTIAIIGVLTVKFQRVRRDTTAVRHQVENDHSTNLREEQDARDRRMHRRFDTLATLVAGNSVRLTSVEALIRKHDDEIDALEDTLNPNKKKE